MSGTIDFAGDPHIGIFARVVGELAIVPPATPARFVEALRNDLGAEVLTTTIQGMNIVGSLVAGNRHGLVVSGLASEEELAVLREHTEVLPLRDRINASGNVLLVNDGFAALHPDMREEVAGEVCDFLGVRGIRLSIGGIKTVGMAGTATNRGILVASSASDSEISALERASGLPVGRGSVNMGSRLIGSGLLVNEKGYLAGFQSSGIELGRIEEVFGFLG